MVVSALRGETREGCQEIKVGEVGYQGKAS
jgi:hypothetical protein